LEALAPRGVEELRGFVAKKAHLRPDIYDGSAGGIDFNSFLERVPESHLGPFFAYQNQANI